jgi:hypothetical protein
MSEAASSIAGSVFAISASTRLVTRFERFQNDATALSSLHQAVELPGLRESLHHLSRLQRFRGLASGVPGELPVVIVPLHVVRF